MNFFEWTSKDPLTINKYGIPEPISYTLRYPDVILVPLLAFDKNLNRVGYGGGFYDRTFANLKKLNFSSLLLNTSLIFQLILAVLRYV